MTPVTDAFAPETDLPPRAQLVQDRRLRTALNFSPASNHPNGRSMKTHTEAAPERASLLRRNLILVASYLAIMIVIAGAQS